MPPFGRRRVPFRASAEEKEGRISVSPPPRHSLRTASNRACAIAAAAHPRGSLSAGTGGVSTLFRVLFSIFGARTCRTRRTSRPSFVYARRRVSLRATSHHHRGRLLLLPVVEAAASLFLVLSAVRLARVAAVEDGVGLRPSWLPLADGVSAATGGSISEVFRSGEVLQMYHLQVGCGVGLV